jgi:Tfp pilus assembly protein PilW
MTDAPAPEASDDAGFTLVDVLVSMLIMSIVMVIFTTGIIQLHRLANSTEARSDAQSQISVALLRLDKEVRYAAGIGLPHTVNGNPYVEYLITRAGGDQCVQLRVAGGILSRRTWIPGAVPLAPAPWTALASNITTAQPFEHLAATDTIGHQRLTVKLAATSGNGRNTVRKASEITFTALNTGLQTGSDACAEGRTAP